MFDEGFVADKAEVLVERWENELPMLAQGACSSCWACCVMSASRNPLRVFVIYMSGSFAFFEAIEYSPAV